MPFMLLGSKYTSRCYLYSKNGIEMNEQYFLTSKQIGFRTWCMDDLQLAIDLWCDDEVTKFISGPFSNSQASNRLLTERSILRRYNIQYWPIFLLETNEFIGCCGLRPYQIDERIYEIGCHIKSTQWRKGYADETSSAVIHYAFNKLQINGLYARHHPENTYSKILLEKLGFKRAPKILFTPSGLPHPSYLLLQSDYQKQ